jgi:hypothetical protein
MVSLYPLDPEDLGFHVVVWDTARERCARTLSANVSIDLAIAAYNSALIYYRHHGERILLKIGARVIRDSAKLSQVKS